MKLPENGHRTLERDYLDHRVVHAMPPPPPHIWTHPHDQILQPLYLSTLFYNFLHNFTTRGLCSHLALPSQRSSTSNSLVCTSTATSFGDPSSRRVRHLRERPSAVTSESDCGSSKVSCSSSPITISQSRKHHLLGSCSPSWSSLLCSSSTSIIGSLGSTSSCSSSCSCSSCSSSDVEESAGQLTSQRAPNLMIRATSWETHST